MITASEIAPTFESQIIDAREEMASTGRPASVHCLAYGNRFKLELRDYTRLLKRHLRTHHRDLIIARWPGRFAPDPGRYITMRGNPPDIPHLTDEKIPN